MIRLTSSTNGLTQIVKLEGKLVHPLTDQLIDVCRVALDQGKSVELDMSKTSYVDQPCLIVLQDLIRQGIVLISKSPFVSELLKERFQ